MDRRLPVDVYVPGCPPRPEALLHGLLMAMERREQKINGSRTVVELPILHEPRPLA